jgi:hypothetical protein
MLFKLTGLTVLGYTELKWGYRTLKLDLYSTKSAAPIKELWNIHNNQLISRSYYGSVSFISSTQCIIQNLTISKLLLENNLLSCHADNSGHKWWLCISRYDDLKIAMSVRFIFLYVQVFHILDGMPIVTIHETTRNVKKGDFFFVPQGKCIFISIEFTVCY